jgi:hypothetical protein
MLSAVTAEEYQQSEHRHCLSLTFPFELLARPKPREGSPAFRITGFDPVFCPASSVMAQNPATVSQGTLDSESWRQRQVFPRSALERKWLKENGLPPFPTRLKRGLNGL